MRIAAIVFIAIGDNFMYAVNRGRMTRSLNMRAAGLHQLPKINPLPGVCTGNTSRVVENIAHQDVELRRQN